MSAAHRSNPGTPTQPRRPDFIGVRASPQRRFLSEGELLRDARDVRELAASPQRGNYQWAERPPRRPAPAQAPPINHPVPRPARPLSFIRALEVQDQLERAPPPDPPDRASVYDCNYEISV